jgi:hypothetical protein
MLIILNFYNFNKRNIELSEDGAEAPKYVEAFVI